MDIEADGARSVRGPEDRAKQRSPARKGRVGSTPKMIKKSPPTGRALMPMASKRPPILDGVGNRINQQPHETAHQCPVDPNELKVTSYQELDPPRGLLRIP